jgi:hypothetical protein
MIPDGQYTAVVDRIEDGLATIVIEEDGTDAYELVVEPVQLPDDGQHADAVLSVEIRDNELVEATYEASETGERQESAQRRFDQLSERPPSDDNE